MIPGRDPAAQPERTRFAWRRTTLAFAVVVILVVRRLALGGFSLAGYVAAALAICAWLAFLALAQRRIRALACAQPREADPVHAMATAACVVATATCGAVILL